MPAQIEEYDFMLSNVFSIILSAVTFAMGLLALAHVKTDVGMLCSILVLQCGWIIHLLSRIANNTARR